jgi:hypothetical protein
VAGRFVVPGDIRRNQTYAHSQSRLKIPTERQMLGRLRRVRRRPPHGCRTPRPLEAMRRPRAALSARAKNSSIQQPCQNAARRLRWDTRNKRPNDLMECFTVPLLCKWLIRLSSCSPLGTASKINDFYLIFEWIRSRKSFWATLWATSRKTRVAGRCHDARRQHDATIAPKRFSELMIESTRQATRDRNSACSPGASGAAVDRAHPPP